MGIKKEKISADFQASRLPATIRIGVTGHRTLENESVIKECVKAELRKLEGIVCKELPHSPHVFIAISPLAEGSDRLVAREVLELPVTDKNFVPMLEIVLPMPEDIYIKDFTMQNSLEEYNSLKKQAHSFKTLDYNGVRADGYENVGHYVVQNCDILFVIWNGEISEKRGGTYDIFEYAKKIGCPYVWINSITGTVQEDKTDNIKLFKLLKHLDQYNNESERWLKPADISLLSDSRCKKFLDGAPDNALSTEAKKSFRDDLMPKYARASLLSKFYKKMYNYANVLIYCLAALAVATVALQFLFLPKHPELVWFEVFYMFGILATVTISNKIGLHRRWIDYRFIAERIKTTIFFTIAGIDYEPLGYLPQVNKANQADYWIVNAFSWIWRTRPRKAANPTIDSNTLEKLKDYLKTSWIDDQLKFYEKNSQELKEKYDQYERFGLILFFITMIGAFLHASEILPFSEDSAATPILVSLGIIFPVIGASLSGLLSNREFQRIATRYEQMVYPLENIKQQLDTSITIEQLVILLEQANELMLRENQDWRVSFLAQKLKPP